MLSKKIANSRSAFCEILFIKRREKYLQVQKNRCTFAPAIEKQQQVVDREGAIFEEIYIIRQVVQVSESRDR